MALTNAADHTASQLKVGSRRYSIDHSPNDMTLLDFAPSLARPVEHLCDAGRYRIRRPMRRMRARLAII